MEFFCASDVFREGAENCARGGRAPHFNFGFWINQALFNASTRARSHSSACSRSW